MYIVECVLLKHDIIELGIFYPRTCADVELLFALFAPEDIVPDSKISAFCSAGVGIEKECRGLAECNVVTGPVYSYIAVDDVYSFHRAY